MLAKRGLGFDDYAPAAFPIVTIDHEESASSPELERLRRGLPEIVSRARRQFVTSLLTRGSSSHDS